MKNPFSNRHIDTFDVSNPLTWPFLMATFSYGVAFLVFPSTSAVTESSLYSAMYAEYPTATTPWAVIAIITTVMGAVFLKFHAPKIGKFSGMTGFMLWIFAALSWAQHDGLLAVFVVAIPNIWFWVWQYIYLMRLAKDPVLCKRLTHTKK